MQRPQPRHEARSSVHDHRPANFGETTIEPAGHTRAQSAAPSQRSVSKRGMPRKVGGVGSTTSGYPFVALPPVNRWRNRSNTFLLSALAVQAGVAELEALID